MEDLTLIAVTRPGLEAVVKRELSALGFGDLKVSNGRIQFPAALADIPRANLWLRCADRILVKMGLFSATSFDDLFEGVKKLPWEAWIPADGRFPVKAATVKSTLQSARSCQAIVKKAIVDRLQGQHQVAELPESGPEFPVHVSINKDEALLTLDTSGIGLHKRGYRLDAGEAPLKETLAAAMVLLSYWHKDRLLIDPLCGSGTILIEAALIGRNIAPGLNRGFNAEEWPAVPPELWSAARQDARKAVNQDGELQLSGSDKDEAVIRTARNNANHAGVGKDISFSVSDLADVWIDQQYGVLISNPPYGIRLDDYQQVKEIYRNLNKMFRKKAGWSIYILTADKRFTNYMQFGRPDRVRKLYNGNIQVNYYQYYGQKPPRE